MLVAGNGSSAVVVIIDGDIEVALGRLDGLVRPDLGMIDALARLQLAARRAGWSVRLRHPCENLRALLDLVGLAELFLDDAVPDAGLPLEAGGQAEGGEQLRVEEVVEPGDPAA